MHTPIDETIDEILSMKRIPVEQSVDKNNNDVEQSFDKNNNVLIICTVGVTFMVIFMFLVFKKIYKRFFKTIQPPLQYSLDEPPPQNQSDIPLTQLKNTKN
jgi:hypothetical protein